MSLFVSLLLDLVYALALVAAMPWFLWQRLVRGKRRGGWLEKLLGLVPRRTSSGPCIWLHAVSVGEVNLLAPLVAELERRRSDCQLVITATTLAGYTLAIKRYAAHTVCYAPADFSWAIAVFLEL